MDIDLKRVVETARTVVTEHGDGHVYKRVTGDNGYEGQGGTDE